MNEKRKGLMPVSPAILLLFTLFLASCGGQSSQAAKDNGPTPVSDPKLNAAYARVLVLPVDIGAQFVKDYPYASSDCRVGLVVGLQESKRFQVKLVDELPARTEGKTLVVKLTITDMRIASKAARIWAGAMAGSSYVNLKMTLIDGRTGQVIRDKEFSTRNSAFAAAWTSGTTDDSIAKDMGRIIGDYITAVVP